MKNKLLWLGVVVAFLSMAGAGLGQSKIVTKGVDYSAQGVVMKGYMVYDENSKGKQPGVLVVHEWWGLNEYARMRARMLADLGYVALAVDMYGEGKQAVHPADAGKFSSQLMKTFDVARARFMAAMDFLQKQTMVDADRIAAIGYCFGGGVVLNMARQSIDLKGVASFHGSLTAVEPAKRGEVKAKILVLNGAADKFIPQEQIESFKKEMTFAGADFMFISYPGAIHSFTNPQADELGKKFNMAIGYDGEADRASWNELKEFLNRIFSN